MKLLKILLIFHYLLCKKYLLYHKIYKKTLKYIEIIYYLSLIESVFKHLWKNSCKFFSVNSSFKYSKILAKS